jgi:hypothetical protein
VAPLAAGERVLVTRAELNQIALFPEEHERLRVAAAAFLAGEVGLAPVPSPRSTRWSG